MSPSAFPSSTRPRQRRRSTTRRWRLGACLACIAALAVATHDRAPATADDPTGFTNFETEPVRPLALAADGKRLYALNTADDRLEIFDVSGPDVVRVGDVAVGLRPVALALRAPGEVWVSNHLSDSVSVVDVTDPAAARVVRTLPVGDEPRDIVVGGRNREKVFVAAARRAAVDEPGVGRADVWVFDARDPDAPPTVLTLFGMKPRALAVTPDGLTVFAAIFHSGNKTTVVDEAEVDARGGLPPPTPANTSGAEAPKTGLIVREQAGRWLDEIGRDWSDAIPFEIPDQDVFVIDARSDPPVVTGSIGGVGTVLFNMAFKPASGVGEVWVTNTEARNDVRFEPNLRGHATESRVTRISLRSVPPTVTEVHLNSHIDYNVSPGPPSEIAQTLGQPTAIEFNRNGSTAYVAAFGSRKVGVLDVSAQVTRRIDVGFGPGGLALDEDRGRLFVLNHLAATISVVDLAAGRATDTIPLHFDPTPADVHAGRPFLYDMMLGGGHGDMACATCHVFADLDGLAWDLGDPTGTVQQIPFALAHENFFLKPKDFKQHPMKGPMTTQSFRGMVGGGPMHWRADRFGPAGKERDELESFSKFMPAFAGLNGRETDLPRQDMDKLARFLFTIRYPPNPYQNVDRSLTEAQKAGSDQFVGTHKVDSGVENCAGCHTLPIGTNGRTNFEGSRTGQDFKAPHLRNVYQKIGRFDEPGPQVTGFGLAHDGSDDTIVHFLESDVFDFQGATALEKEARRKEVAAYVLAFDTGMAPAVGQQVTLGDEPAIEAIERFATLSTRATAGDCDLVARGNRSGAARGWLWVDGLFQPDRREDPRITENRLINNAGAPGAETTFTCVPPGDGVRSALDRDRDGYWNGDEVAAGSDPADPNSIPNIGSPTPPTPTVATPVVTPPTPTPSATATRPPVGRAFLPKVGSEG